MNAVVAFRQELAAPVAERLALTIARIAFPWLNLEKYLRELDDLADIVEARLRGVTGGEARATGLMRVLRDDLGFRGNDADYYNADNSFFNLVLERRVGLPIMLSLVCMAVGQRMGMQVEGMGFPGHFMACYRDGNGSWLIDLFNGKVIALEDAESYLSGLFGQPMRLNADAFAPVTAVALALRILNNLRNVYLSSGETGMAARVVGLMLEVTPESKLLWQELGLLCYRNGEWEAAVRALRRYFYLTNQFELTGFDEQGRLQHQAESQDERQLLTILQEIEQLRRRLN